MTAPPTSALPVLQTYDDTRALVADARAGGVGTIFLSAQDDAVAPVNERVGFVRVGTACLGEPDRPEETP